METETRRTIAILLIFFSLMGLVSKLANLEFLSIFFSCVVGVILLGVGVYIGAGGE